MKQHLESPEAILQKLVEIAVELRRTDSAGVSVERKVERQRISTNGSLLPGSTARFWMRPCRNFQVPVRSAFNVEPQKFWVNERFFEILGVKAALVTDGILLPWEVEGMRGTIFIISHSRSEAFDWEDLRLMEILQSSPP